MIAAEASLAAERRRGDVDDHAEDAARLRAEQADALRRADKVDPYVDADADRAATDRGDDDRAATDSGDGDRAAPDEQRRRRDVT